MDTSESDDREAAGLTKKLKSLRRRASKLLLQAVLSRSTSLPGTLVQSEVVVPSTESENSLIRNVIITTDSGESPLKETASSRPTSKSVTNCGFGHPDQSIVERKVILSPVRHVPPEVLQNIFIHTLPTAVQDSGSGSRLFFISQLPWALSQVCQLWRNAMLSFSIMWRELPLVKLDEVYTAEKPYLDFLTEMLKRSRNTPIRLVIVGNGNGCITHPAIDMLVLHSDRWEEIRIHSQLTILPAFQKIKGRLSSLQSLSLTLYYRSIPNPIDLAVHDLFQIAPQLRYVELNGFTDEFVFPTHQLIHYRDIRTSLHQLIQVICSAASLRILKFHEYRYSAEGRTLAVALRLPDLIVLDAHFDHLSTFHESFFNNITIPAIEELRVETYAENVITPIYSMILRSGSPCLLKILYLKFRFAPGELPSLLRLTPLVTNLTITLPSTQDIFAFTPHGNSPPLLPLLDECEFLSRDVTPSWETIQALKLFASTRCELPDNATSAGASLAGEFHPLQAFRIEFGWQSDWYRLLFEGWNYSDMADELYKQGERLLTMLPELRWRVIPFKRKFDLRWKSRVTNLLTRLETLEIEKASDICMSGTQHILYAISLWFKIKDVISSFRPIAERILKKWEPMLINDIRDLRWLSTRSSLQYLSATHPRCSSPDAAKAFFYGINSYTATTDASDQFHERVMFFCARHDVYERET